MIKEPEPHSTPIEIEPPFLSRFQCGNTGIDYLHCVDSGRPGPHAMITSVVHGNEFSGAISVAELIDNPPTLQLGRLSLCFVNAEACSRFDRERPWHSRFIDEDFNRVWNDDVLSGPRLSLELGRARDLRQTIDSVDYLLDLHSMASDSPAIILAGSTDRGREFAKELNIGLTIVLDQGHQAGQRLRDYGEFNAERSQKTALLVECGQHWRATTVHTARKAATAFLSALNMVRDENPRTSEPASSVIRVTDTITATSNVFEFTENYSGLEQIGAAGTTIANDGDLVITTPYDGCVLVMPTHGVQLGQTAVRLGRVLPEIGDSSGC